MLSGFPILVRDNITRFPSGHFQVRIGGRLGLKSRTTKLEQMQNHKMLPQTSLLHKNIKFKSFLMINFKYFPELKWKIPKLQVFHIAVGTLTMHVSYTEEQFEIGQKHCLL